MKARRKIFGPLVMGASAALNSRSAKKWAQAVALTSHAVAGRDARADTRSKTSIFTRWIAMVSVLLLAGAALASGPASAHASAASASTSPPPVTAGGSPGPSPAGKGPVKGPPPGAATPGAAAAEPQLSHAVTRLDGFTDGGFGSFTVARPRLADTDAHSLAELSVEGGIPNDIVEVGWTVDRGLNGDAAPHLFVFHWVAGNPVGYNGQGFVPRPGAAEKPGDLLVTGSVHKFMIQHYQGNWWIGDNDDWFGRYPDSLWPHLDPQGNVDGSTFTKAIRVQWFGEVATYALRPCSQMGNGLFSSQPGAAHIDELGEFNGPVVQLHVFSDRPENNYTATANGDDGIRFGGPGACVAPSPVAVPNLIGLSTAAARNTIMLAGLKVGVVSPLIQPNCSRFDQVISQTPESGQLARGGLVNFEYSSGPPGGCSPE